MTSNTAILRQAWERSQGAPWEPRDPKHPFFDWAIREGYLRRATGRSGFEAFRDAVIVWTDAGLTAMRKETRT